VVTPGFTSLANIPKVLETNKALSRISSISARVLILIIVVFNRMANIPFIIAISKCVKRIYNKSNKDDISQFLPLFYPLNLQHKKQYNVSTKKS
jgi:hypothetical protein